MSEFQRIAFRAIDGPVSDDNLKYMQKQSSRAEITKWAFDNEYNFGDFGGDAVEMMRRGYDLHLHYANFGIRKLLLRFPHGLPDRNAAKPYFGEESLQLLPDKNGPGCILSIRPCHEPGDLDELWEFDQLIDRLVPLRAEILSGDLRPLYLGHLAMACDGNHDPETTREGPVPAGLKNLSDAQSALAELYGLSESFVLAAAEKSPPPPAKVDIRGVYLAWLERQPAQTKDAWLAEWLSSSDAGVRSEILAQCRQSTLATSWPTVPCGRTMAELEAAAEIIHEENKRKEAEAAVRKKAKRLAAMGADPDSTLRETEELVQHRSTRSYTQVADLLADLREALAGSERAGLAEEQAKKLKSKNPTLNKLTGALREKGFLGRK